MNLQATAPPVDDPIRDPARLEEIIRLDLFAPEVREVLDDLARRAAERLNLPIGMVSLVLDEAQYFVGAHGIDGWLNASNGSPVEWSYCQYTVTDHDEFVVENAEQNPRTKNSPFATDEGLRCYAGIPLETSRGYVIGSFCVAGDEARRFTERDLAELRVLAAETMDLIEARVEDA
jgi:GAF domain-containing protein